MNKLFIILCVLIIRAALSSCGITDENVSDCNVSSSQSFASDSIVSKTENSNSEITNHCEEETINKSDEYYSDEADIR